MNTAQSRQIATVLDRITDAFYALDDAWHIIFLNKQAEDHFGLSRRELIGNALWDIFPALVDTQFYKECFEARESERERSVEQYDPLRNKWFEFNLLPSPGTLCIFFSDVSERRKEEDERRHLLALEQNARAEAQINQRHYQAVAEAMPQIVWTARADGWLDYCNQQWFAYTGLSTVQSEGWGWRGSIHSEDVEEAMRSWKQAIVNGEAYEYEYRIRRAYDGAYRWHLCRALPVRSALGTVTKWIGTCTDIDDQKRSEETQSFLSRASKILSSPLDFKENLRALAQESVLSFADMCLVDLVDPITGVFPLYRTHHDPRLARTLQAEQETVAFSLVQGHASRSAQLVQSHTDAEAPRGYQALAVGSLRLAVRSYITVPLTQEGTAFGFISFVTTSADKVYGKADLSLAQEVAYRASLSVENAKLLESAKRELNERKQAEDALRHQAFHDTLTDLPNRSLFKDRLTSTLYHAERHGTQCAILFLDLDRFKKVNDTLGHHVGDLLLQETSRRLLGCVRKEDTVARFGGDEFVLLLPSIERPEDAVLVAEKILSRLNEPSEIQGQEMYLSTSVGIAVYPTDGEDANVLIKNADVALYRAKELGRGTYQLYTRTLGLKTSERLGLEQNLRAALDRNEFRVHYQPVLDLSSGMVTGAEALVRWEHPELGLVFPHEFIPIAEESDVILHIGDWVLRTVCAHLKGWSSNKKQQLPRIAINLSPRQFADRDALLRIGDILRDNEISPERIEIEITEGVAMNDIETTFDNLRGLQEMGIKIALDDFGTGYSSLSYLKRFPLHVLKIDRSFVQNCIADEQDRAIINAIISMAHSLKLRVVAEGVETNDQLNFLRSVGCDLIQGYLISPSLPPNLFYTFYRTKNRHMLRKLRRAHLPVEGDKPLEGMLT